MRTTARGEVAFVSLEGISIGIDIDQSKVSMCGVAPQFDDAGFMGRRWASGMTTHERGHCMEQMTCGVGAV